MWVVGEVMLTLAILGGRVGWGRGLEDGQVTEHLIASV